MDEDRAGQISFAELEEMVRDGLRAPWPRAFAALGGSLDAALAPAVAKLAAADEVAAGREVLALADADEAGIVWRAGIGVAGDADGGTLDVRWGGRGEAADAAEVATKAVGQLDRDACACWLLSLAACDASVFATNPR